MSDAIVYANKIKMIIKNFFWRKKALKRRKRIAKRMNFSQL